MLTFFGGIAASLFAWLIVVNIFTARLRISELNKFPDESEPCGFRYRVKVQNRSRIFAASDLGFHARLVVKGADPKRTDTQTSLLMPVAEDPVFPVLSARKWGARPSDYERVYTLRIHELRGKGLARLRPETRTKIDDGTITLEDLLAAGGEDGFVRLAVSCSNARAGLRRTYVRKFPESHFGKFRPGSIRVWDFEQSDSMQATDSVTQT